MTTGWHNIKRRLGNRVTSGDKPYKLAGGAPSTDEIRWVQNSSQIGHDDYSKRQERTVPTILRWKPRENRNSPLSQLYLLFQPLTTSKDPKISDTVCQSRSRNYKVYVNMTTEQTIFTRMFLTLDTVYCPNFVWKDVLHSIRYGPLSDIRVAYDFSLFSRLWAKLSLPGPDVTRKNGMIQMACLWH